MRSLEESNRHRKFSPNESEIKFPSMPARLANRWMRLEGE
jgi:hypothetical protein